VRACLVGRFSRRAKHARHIGKPVRRPDQLRHAGDTNRPNHPWRAWSGRAGRASCARDLRRHGATEGIHPRCPAGPLGRRSMTPRWSAPPLWRRWTCPFQAASDPVATLAFLASNSRTSRECLRIWPLVASGGTAQLRLPTRAVRRCCVGGPAHRSHAQLAINTWTRR
jgi:hypothetical protein